MKLFNPPKAKRALTALAVAALTGAGVAQAQFTGIGTTGPSATLHVVPVTPGTHEPIRFESIIDLADADKATYSEVLVYDSGTGLFRREAITDILDDNGEWIVLDEGLGTERIVPRRFQTAMDVNGGAINLNAVTTVDAGLTVTAGNNTALGGNLTVAGTSTLNDALTVNSTAVITGALTLNTAANLTPVDQLTKVLIQGAGDVVQHITVEDLMEDTGFWQYTDASENAIQPRDADVTGTITINATGIGVTGTHSVTGNSSVGGQLTVTGLSDLNGALEVAGTTTLSTVANAAPAIGTDKVLLQQDGSDLVEHVTVDELLQANAEWRDAGTGNPWIFANQANGAGNDVVVTDAGAIGIGTTTPSDALQIVGGGIDLDATGSVAFGAVSAITGAATGLTNSTTGNYAITATGGTSVITAQANGGPLLTVNNLGLHIGGVTPNSRQLYVAGVGDDVQFLGATQVTNVSTNGLDIATNPTSVFERVLITDHSGVVRYIDADDLVSSASEWVYEDNGTAGITSDDRIYVRRLDATVPTDDDVFVDGVGNMVLAATKAYQFGDNTNQVNAIGITASANYTMDMNAALTMDITNGLSVNTGAGEDVNFTEAGAGNPWLYFAAADVAGDKGRVGIGTNAPLASLHVAGNIVASHTAQTSDRRFKRNIEDFSNALDVVKALRGVSYSFRADEFPAERFDDAKHLGFIAQELREVLPDAVFEREDGYLTVDYSSVTPVLAEAVEELANRVEALEAENASLRGGNADTRMGAVSTKQLRDLEARLADMDARLLEVAGRK